MDHVDCKCAHYTNEWSSDTFESIIALEYEYCNDHGDDDDDPVDKRKGKPVNE